LLNELKESTFNKEILVHYTIVVTVDRFNCCSHLKDYVVGGRNTTKTIENFKIIVYFKLKQFLFKN